MVIDKTGTLWRGENFDDLAGYVTAFEAGGYRVAHALRPICRPPSNQLLCPRDAR